MSCFCVFLPAPSREFTHDSCALRTQLQLFNSRWLLHCCSCFNKTIYARGIFEVNLWLRFFSDSNLLLTILVFGCFLHIAIVDFCVLVSSWLLLGAWSRLTFGLHHNFNGNVFSHMNSLSGSLCCYWLSAFRNIQNLSAIGPVSFISSLALFWSRRLMQIQI